MDKSILLNINNTGTGQYYNRDTVGVIQLYRKKEIKDFL